MEYKVKINSMFYEFIFSNVTFGKIFSIQSQSNNEDFIAIKAKAKQLITLQMPQLMNFLPYYNDLKIQNIIKISEDLKKSFDTVVVVGMGGALLNSVSLDLFLSQRSDVDVIFCDKLCPQHLEKIKNSINLANTCFIFISNSGNTIVTVSIAEYWYEILTTNNIIDFEKRFIFI